MRHVRSRGARTWRAVLLTAVIPAALLYTGMPQASAAPSQGDATQHVACTGNGTDGSRVQAIYLRESDDPDNYAQRVLEIRQALWRLDQNIDVAARETGQSRRVRFLHGAPTVARAPESCQATIDNVVIPDSGTAGRHTWGPALDARGYARKDRKLIIFTDSNAWGTGNCFATLVGPEGGGRAWVNRQGGCWDDYVLTHEVMHAFGVPHLWEKNLHEGPDVMDQGGKDRPECNGPAKMSLIDCGKDTYFNAAKATTTYLTSTATGITSPVKNIAGSSYFATGPSAPDLTFRIRMRDSGMCLEPNRGTADGDLIVQRPCTDSDTQRWVRTVNRDGYDTLRNKASGKCVGDPDGSTASGTAVRQYSCDGTDAQRWWLGSFPVGKAGPSFEIQNKRSSLPLSTRDAGKNSGDAIVQSGGATRLTLDSTSTTAPATSPATATPAPTRSGGTSPDESSSRPVPSTSSSNASAPPLARTGASGSTPLIAGTATVIVLAGAALTVLTRRRGSARR